MMKSSQFNKMLKKYNMRLDLNTTEENIVKNQGSRIFSMLDNLYKKWPDLFNPEYDGEDNVRRLILQTHKYPSADLQNAYEVLSHSDFLGDSYSSFNQLMCDLDSSSGNIILEMIVRWGQVNQALKGALRMSAELLEGVLQLKEDPTRLASLRTIFALLQSHEQKREIATYLKYNFIYLLQTDCDSLKNIIAILQELNKAQLLDNSSANKLLLSLFHRQRSTSSFNTSVYSCETLAYRRSIIFNLARHEGLLNKQSLNLLLNNFFNVELSTLSEEEKEYYIDFKNKVENFSHDHKICWFELKILARVAGEIRDLRREYSLGINSDHGVNNGLEAEAPPSYEQSQRAQRGLR